MNIKLDNSKIREKSILLIETENEQAFKNMFDSEGYLDLIENIEDYIAEGVVSYFTKQYLD